MQVATMVKPEDIADALPDVKKADSLLDNYLSEKACKPDHRFSPQRYFNDTKKTYLWVRTPDLTAVVKTLKKHKAEPAFRQFIDMLWYSNVFEKMIIAAKSYAFIELNFDDYTKIIRSIDNWAHCDVLCASSGAYFRDHPGEIKRLMPLAKSKNPWERRFATVSLIGILREPNADHGTALQVLDILMTDTDLKVIGAATDWMVREYLRKNYDAGLAYVRKWADYAQRTGDKNVRWVLVRARHKLKENDKKEIEKKLSVRKKGP